MSALSPSLDTFLTRFLDASPRDLRQMAPYLRPVRYDAGQVIFPEGEARRDVVVMMEGLVRVFYLHEAREVNLRLLCAPAAVVAMSSFITKTPSQETIEAVSPVIGTLARIGDYEDAHPGLLAERLRRVLAEQHYLAMERRLRTLQWKTARERYEYFLQRMEKPIVESMPGYHIASYLGVTPESLSRVRARRRKPARGRS